LFTAIAGTKATNPFTDATVRTPGFFVIDVDAADRIKALMFQKDAII
jgi:hypothetical protein